MQTWPAPAKLNLFLHVTSRRADGYHTLQTVFQFLDYADELRFVITDTGCIRRTAAVSGVAEEDDLCLRAARLLQAESGATKGANIHLNKHIPVGAGLGGGSSDAATTLMALNRLWNTGLAEPDLAALGLRLGADVPVFIRGHAAWAEGIGEALIPVDLEEAWYVVVVPPIHISTAAVFSDPELTRHSPAITIRDFLAGQGRNDLEPVVRRRYPEVDRAWRWLAGFGDARMSGSGGCVFLKTDDREAGSRVVAQIPEPLTGFVARGMNVHPLRAPREDGSKWGVAKR